MRKVSKFALALVAIICFLCFLFYKGRYDRLYNVLEVLEFFGNDKAAIQGSGGVNTGNSMSG
jgi:hypothetical protein